MPKLVRDSKAPITIVICLCLLTTFKTDLVYGAAFSYKLPDNSKGVDPKAITVVGIFQHYCPKKEDTLLDIARKFDLGFQELTSLYPDMDPWLPPEGLKLLMPTCWILPETKRNELVINVPEMRLYLFLSSIHMVTTFPISLGDPEWVTPVGLFFVERKRTNPTWHIPESLQGEYGGMTSMPPGPGNPLGTHCLNLSPGDYRIHGTHQPWGVGRLVSHGCIRLYPEDIVELYKLVPVGTPVEIIYEPVKIGFKNGRIFIEVHHDIYNRIPNLLQYTMDKINAKDLRHKVDSKKVILAVSRKEGIPVDVTQD